MLPHWHRSLNVEYPEKDVILGQMSLCIWSNPWWVWPLKAVHPSQQVDNMPIFERGLCDASLVPPHFPAMTSSFSFSVTMSHSKSFLVSNLPWVQHFSSAEWGPHLPFGSKEAFLPSSTCLPALLLTMEFISLVSELCLSGIVSLSPLLLLSLENPFQHIPEVKLPLVILNSKTLRSLVRSKTSALRSSLESCLVSTRMSSP